MSMKEVLYEGRYETEISNIIKRFDFQKTRKLMEICGEIWPHPSGEIGIPSAEEIKTVAIGLLKKMEISVESEDVAVYKGLVASKKGNSLGIMYIPVVVSVEILIKDKK